MDTGFFRQCLLIGQFELYRVFASRKGLVNIATFGLVWCFILIYPLRFFADMWSEGRALMHGFGQLSGLGFERLQIWPVPEYGVYWHIALILFPMLSVSIAADQTCSDRVRGTLRFITLRASRDSVFFGRFLGSLFIQITLIAFSVLSCLALVLIEHIVPVPVALAPVSALFINVLLAILPFTAMMALLSTLLKSARQATVWAILIWTFLSAVLSGLAYFLPIVSNLKYLIPGYQLMALMQTSLREALLQAYIPLLQTIVLLGAGRWLINKQSL